MDILRDSSGAHLLQISRDFSIPSFVTDAVALQKAAASDIPSRLFADQYSREYPISSKADTWLSAAYLSEDMRDDKSARLAKAAEVIKEAAAAYGIENEVKEIFEHGYIEKKAEDDSMYGLPETKGFPMHDRKGVKMACDYFAANRFDYDAATRRRIAKAIEKRAKEEDVETNDEVRCECGEGVPNVEHMIEQVEQRAERAKGTDLEGVLDDLLKTLRKSDGSEIADELDKIEEVLNSFDEELGMDKEYNRTCIAPSDFMHSIPISDAEEFDDDTIDMDGDMLSLKRMSMLPTSVFSDSLGDDFLSSVMSGGSIMPSLLGKALGRAGNSGRKSVMMIIRRM